MNVRKVTVLPREEWNRIQNRLAEKSQDELRNEHRHAERERLHQKSKSVVKNWSNTIQGQRQRKLEARKERLEAEELELQRIDREEAKFQQAKRKQAIDKAKTLQYYQTDRVKNFHRAMVLSEVLKERDAQVAMRHRVAEFGKMRETKFEQINSQKFAEQKKQEEENQRRAQEQTLSVARYQKGQVKAKAEIIKSEILADIEQGRQYRKADDDYKQWLKAKTDHERNEKVLLNQDIIEQIGQKKRYQVLETQQSQAEDEEIRLFESARSKLAKERKHREIGIRKHKQAISERILDKLVATARNIEEEENLIVENAIKKQDEAAAKREAAEANARQMALADIRQHRESERARAAELKQFEKLKNEEDLKVRIAIDNDYLTSEKDRWQTRREAAQTYQGAHKIQINERATKERLAIDDEILCDKREKEARDREEVEFQTYVSDVITRAKDRGVNAYPLIKAAQPGDGGGHGPVDAVGTRPSFQSTDGYGVQLPTYQKNSTDAVKKFYTPNDMAHAKKRFGFVW